MVRPETVTCKRLGLASTAGSRPATSTSRTSLAPAELPAPTGTPDTFVTPVMAGGGLTICSSTGKALAEPLFTFSVAGPIGKPGESRN